MTDKHYVSLLLEDRIKVIKPMKKMGKFCVPRYKKQHLRHIGEMPNTESTHIHNF